MGQKDEISTHRSSVAPGINDEFASATDLQRLVAHFSRREREVFQQRHEIVTKCQLDSDWSVADIGAATGLFSRLLARKTKHVYAIDLFEHFVQYIRAMRLVNVTPLQCDSKSIPLSDATIDMAFVCNTYHHFEYPDSVLRSIHIALRDEGRLVLVDLHPNPQSKENPGNHVRGDRKSFCIEVESAGFRLLSVDESFLKSGYMCRFQKV